VCGFKKVEISRDGEGGEGGFLGQLGAVNTRYVTLSVIVHIPNGSELGHLSSGRQDTPPTRNGKDILHAVECVDAVLLGRVRADPSTSQCIEVILASGIPHHVQFIASSGTYASRNGTLYLTNQRILYIPEPQQPHFSSLSIPVRNVRNGKFVQPWLVANYYECIVLPVPNGGIPAHMEGSFSFTKGGAFEFSTIYRQIMERLQETGEVPTVAEPLPAYEPPAPSTSSNQAVSDALPEVEEPPPYTS
jgi:hypothetical protein